MSYIQVKDLGGKDRGLKFNQGACDIFYQRINHEEVNASSIYATFYAGLIGNCIVKGEQADFNMEDVCEWVDQMYEGGRKEEIAKVCDAFAETTAYKTRLLELQERIRSLQPTEETEPAKKKAQKT